MNFDKTEIELIDNEIQILLSKSAIQISNPEKDEFISNIFLVQKKNGKYRPVINLKGLNQYVKYFHFKQENLQSVLLNISKNDYFTSIDLCDAYFSISMNKKCRKYLKFVWKDQIYEFTCLCFGLASAPRIFTKLMKVVFSHIRNQGVGSFFYIDDSLLHSPYENICYENTVMLRNLLHSLGFLVNKEKSVFIPTQRIIFLGYLIDSVQFKVFLTEEKIQKILKSANKIYSLYNPVIREVSSLIGLFTSASCAVLLAPIFHRYLDIEKTLALSKNNDNYDGIMSLSENSRNEILWWIKNVDRNEGKSISFGTPTEYIETDASKIGWGAVYGKNKTQGRWMKSESISHINILELLAIKYAFFSLGKNISNSHICIKSDSSTAVQYINNMGGSVVALLEVVREIWFWAADKNNFITAVHIAGKDNITPDQLSRNFSDSSEWKLKENIFRNICGHFFQPNIDLFASRLNKQLSKYVSWFPDPDAMASDAFSFSWKNYLPYVFPPFSIIARILNKVEEEQVRMVLMIVPTWPSQPWFPRLLNCLVDYPVILPFCQDLLRLVHNNQKHPLNMRKLFLVACVVSGIPSKRREFQNQLETSSLSHGESLPRDNMNIVGGNGIFGVIHKKSIPLHQMKYKY